MTTPYMDRANEHDLGDGFSFIFMEDADGVFGLIEHHPHPVDEQHPFGYCGGWVGWRQSGAQEIKHQLIAGGPDDVEHLTIAPSILCRQCGNHGFIREGRWVRA